MGSEEVTITDDSEINVIDLIDLTKESPDALQPYQRHVKNIAANRRIRRSNFSLRRPAWLRDHEDMIAMYILLIICQLYVISLRAIYV